MLKKIDSSQFLVRLLERLSTVLARRRGLPPVIGIVMIVIAFILELANVQAGKQIVEFLQIVLRNGCILVALIGLLLAEPLGE